ALLRTWLPAPSPRGRAAPQHAAPGWLRAQNDQTSHSFLQFFVPAAFCNAHNHIGDEGEQEYHQVHPGLALQAFDDRQVNFERPALRRERQPLRLTVRQALRLDIPFRRVNAAAALDTDHQRRKGDVPMPGLADAVVDNAVENT